MATFPVGSDRSSRANWEGNWKLQGNITNQELVSFSRDANIGCKKEDKADNNKCIIIRRRICNVLNVFRGRKKEEFIVVFIWLKVNFWGANVWILTSDAPAFEILLESKNPKSKMTSNDGHGEATGLICLSAQSKKLTKWPRSLMNKIKLQLLALIMHNSNVIKRKQTN